MKESLIICIVLIQLLNKCYQVKLWIEESRMKQTGYMVRHEHRGMEGQYGNVIC